MRNVNVTDPTFTLLKGGEGEEGKQPIIQLPGAVPPLVDDTGECTSILIFPRDKRAGGTLDHRQTVEDPYDLACKIFLNGDNPLSSETLSKLQYVKDGEDVDMELFQADIRSRFLDILSHSGIIVSQFPSLDRDEDFVTLTIPLEGPTIEYMAARLGYSMPLKRTSYAKVEPIGPYPGFEPMKNLDGQEVLAYDRFTIDSKENFEPFRKVDAIRLLEFWLDQWVSLDVMEEQGIISGYYPCPDPEELETIHHTILTCAGFHPANRLKGILCVRAYFGDQIAFFFRFMMHLCNALIFLALLGGCFYIARRTLLEGERAEIGRTAVAALVSVWAAVMLQVFKRHTCRIKQIWGVSSDEEPIVQLNPEWDYELHRGNCSVFVNLCTVLYILAYVGAIFGVLAWQFQLTDKSVFYSYSSLILVAVIKGGNLLWAKLAPCLITLENLRTERAYSEKLSALLAGVKLFVANWPFFSHAFLTNFIQKKCADTLELAAAEAWKGFDVAQLSPESMKVLESLSFDKGSLVCLPGCLPSDWKNMDSFFDTTCDADLKSNLMTYFFILIAVELAFLVLPIILSYVEILKEYRKVQSSDAEEGSSTYTFLQWEAKKFPYTFDSWGGDKINDYLEVAISYSVIVFWGSILPVVAVFGCIQFFVSYRLRIYRMLYVTRRPQPRVAAGLGIWGDIFQAINVTAVAVNVALTCFFYYPGNSLPLWKQLALFLLAEHVVLLLQTTVQFLIPEIADDVEEIKYYNDHAASLLRNSTSKTHRDHVQPTKCGHINLSTNPENLSTDDDDDST